MTDEKLLGNDDGTYGFDVGANILWMNLFTAIKSGSLTSLRCLSNASSGNIRIGLYSKSDSVPGSLLTSGTGTASVGWVTISVTPYSVVSGTDYFIAVLLDTAAACRRKNTGQTVYYKTPYSYSNGLPATAPTLLTYASRETGFAGWGEAISGNPLFAYAQQ